MLARIVVWAYAEYAVRGEPLRVKRIWRCDRRAKDFGQDAGAHRRLRERAGEDHLWLMFQSSSRRPVVTNSMTPRMVSGVSGRAWAVAAAEAVEAGAVADPENAFPDTIAARLRLRAFTGFTSQG
ncbi:hypothetical protein GCM10022225_61340 [Plantactinospora mayteni]|uniref:Transposase n=1 Tax=Plantactinospora mayteni TaxID=566021 RepID=A0ABQ4EZP0_9ACTN|nr:hypothetical protein Pma05_66960 [Plantactinospora mayteni]